MIEILLKASFAIGIAFLFYKLLLQQESFFTANRIYLIGCIALAFVLPFVSLPKLVDQQGYLQTLFQEHAAREKVQVTEDVAKTRAVPPSLPMPEGDELVLPRQPYEEVVQQQVAQEQSSDTSTGFSLGFWVLLLYLFGVAVFSLSLLFQVGCILLKATTATDKVEDGECVIVNTASRQAPCSFFHYIFIYPDDYDFETYEQIIAHEKIHIRLGHSFDLLLAELAVIILWFNPLVWLLKREIEKNNEYQTDAQLLEKEQVKKDQYQLSLLQIAVPNKPLSITTNYNQSLLKQRIMMMNAKRSTPHAYWKYAFMAPLFFGTLLLINEPAASQHSLFTALSTATGEVSVGKYMNLNAENSSAEPPTAGVPAQPGAPSALPGAPLPPSPELAGPKKGFSLNMQGKQVDMSKGYWYSSQENGEYCLQFKGSKLASSWNMSQCFDKGLFQKQGNDTFVLTKETGTLQLTGNLDAEVGQGKYTFTEDASFRKYLADNDINSNEQNLMFHLFFGDVNRKYVDFLKKNYKHIEGERLQELAIHGIGMADFQNYLALFRQHSNRKPTIEEVVSASIHGIDQEYVQELQALGFKDLSLDKMMEARIHGVSKAFIEDLRKAGYANLSMDKIIEAKIHGITPVNIKEMQSLGFGELSLEKMMELKIHGVNEAYIKSLQSVGLNDLSLDQYIEAKIHGLNPASIKRIKALGYEGLSFEDIMSAQIHGVDAAYVEDLRKAGFQNLSMEKTVSASIHGIDSDFIKKAREEGYNFNSIDKYITLKIHGMAIESLKDDE
ncbi:beta-lactamase regulating signal transducer with metallopeptidase domain [Pontibacter ummariensis]|uniref:Signal transducer regulating beta-lactamase production, contains metallopeptidase domain n=1 Tax=Pontibacter ummariensis TaxID=1610492 RepID=A0A239JXH0_9BACT|nr:M56 family metallopeptidase [Pontibacter ummariensis]PRY07299.1 beta-lactamase regulating signal transducer with metallopeptidase domain [Pontibacter ummariensis]SNT10172.1 Signal transducer regulating beta-lactamase production, contains metallopeptidase domain [Pontibacter ummariensis]